MKKRVTLLLVLIISVFTNGYSQTAYRTIASGDWDAFATWERTTNVYNPTPTWAPAIAGQIPTSNNIVYVTNGFTVTTAATKSCLNLIVEAGGTLTPGATLRVGVASSALGGGFTDTLLVNGTLGAPGSQFALELGTSCKFLWVTGTGTIQMGRFRPNNANLNYPGSPSLNAGTGTTVLFDKDIQFTQSGNYGFSALNSAPVNDSINLTIASGRTITLTDPTSYFHNDLSSSGTANGKFVYNINGTLDLSAHTSTTGGTKLIPFPNASSAITLNVSGLLKLGAYFKADTISTSLGSLSLNILNGGLIDASLTTRLITGTVGAATATPDIYFKVAGTGALRRTTSNGVRIEFPIGTTSYTPVYITGASGPDETFTVTVKDALTNPAPSATTMNKEWNLVEGTPGGNTDTLRFQWTIADQGASGFSGAAPVFICRWNGLLWEYTAASVSGTGSAADPYVARGTGFSAFGLFVLTNSFPVPVSFINVKAYQKQTGVQVEFGNATESDIANYIVERSADGVNFTGVNTLLPKANNGGRIAYTYFDASPNKGNNFYRIKATEKNGQVKYSSTLNINLLSNGIWVNAYPNPVKGSNVNVQLENFEKAVYTISIFNQMGQKVYAKSVNHNGGTATFTVDLPASVKKGVYSLQVSNGATTVNNKIVVE
ncbi:MAG: T9SS type A sorting domain-containing protein [Bacteroidota bacterium]